MAKRVGELLVENGAITADQLRAALRAQLVHGGHLGTCLIELSFLDEATLGRTLAEIHRVGYVTATQLAGIPRSVLDRVPRQIVERRRVVPIGFDDNALQVAMINPNDLIAVEELEFATGLNVRPLVAPEVQIVQAMERFYGIQRGARFLRIRPGVAEPPRTTAQAGAWDAVSAIPLAVGPTPGPSAHAPTGSRAAARISNESPQPVPFVPDTQDSERNKILRQLVAQIPAQDAATARPAAVVSESGLLREFEKTSEELCAAASPGMVAQTVLDCAARGLTRCILLVVANLEARVWDWRGVGLDPAIVARARFPVDTQGIFELVAGSEWYRGPIPQEPSQLQFFHELDLAVPTEALIVPVYFEERLAAMLYGDGGDLGRVVGETDTYVRLTRKMGIALTLLALKRKLREA